MDIKLWGRVALDWLRWGARALWASLAAFFGSRQVWLAGALMAFLGYYGGFLVGARHVPYLKAEARNMKALADQASRREKERAAEVTALKKQLSEAAAKPAPVARRKAPAAAPVKAWWQP